MKLRSSIRLPSSDHDVEHLASSRSRAVLAGGEALGQTAAVLSAALLLVAGAAGVGAQNTAQDAIDRSLLQRQQQKQDLHNRLNDAARNALPGILTPLPPSGSGLLPPIAPAPVQPPFVDLPALQLSLSQQQRLREEQTRNQFLPAPLQEQQTQILLQQFQRENQAQELEREIQRDSNHALPGFH